MQIPTCVRKTLPVALPLYPLDNEGEEAVILGKARRKMEMALKQMKEARETLADIAYWGKGEEKVIPGTERSNAGFI